MNCRNLTRCMMLVLAMLMITPVLIGVNQAWAQCTPCTTNANCSGATPVCGATLVNCCGGIINPDNCSAGSIATGLAFFFASGVCSNANVDCNIDEDTSTCTFEGQCSSTDCDQGATCTLQPTSGTNTNLDSCETIVITSRVQSGVGATLCCIQGGTLTVHTPDGTDHIVTPSGGIPELCNGASATGKPVVYLNDGTTGTRSFSVAYDGFSETGDPNDQAIASTGLPEKYISCNDNNACTTDTCNPATVTYIFVGPDLKGNRLGKCSSTPIPCDDNNACTTEACSLSNGECVTTNTVTCNDNNACTTEQCNASNGECVTTNTVTCNDNNACTTDACNPSNGACGSTNTPAADACEGGAACCNPTTGLCDSNLPGCGGLQGCTPGFWKANADKKQANAWPPVSPSTLVSNVFTIPSCLSSCRVNNKTFGNNTLREALSFQGGNDVCGKAEILLRVGTGGYVNAMSGCVEYPSTSAEVIADVNSALASCTIQTIVDKAYMIDMDNNLGCPLDQQGRCMND